MTMSDKFRKCIPYVIREEGGFVNDPKDPGGATRWGISIRSHRADIGDLDHDGDVDADDVRILPVERAIEIYHAEYWPRIHGDDLPAPMALVLLDTAVNAGVRRAILLLQRSGKLVEDGDLGPRTMAWAMDSQAPWLMLNQRRAFYRSLPTFGRYGDGWLRRVSNVADAARALQADAWKAAR